MTNKVSGKFVISRVVRYCDYNSHVPRDCWDYELNGVLVGMSQRMYAVWMLNGNADTFVTFVKRTNKSLGNAIHSGMQEIHGGHVAGDQFNLGTVIDIKSAIIKKVSEACEHNGENLPRRTVLTHVTLFTAS